MSISPSIFAEGHYKGYQYESNKWNLKELLQMKTTDKVLRFRNRDKSFVLNELQFEYQTFQRRRRHGYTPRI